jgi:hypothetical protein
LAARPFLVNLPPTAEGLRSPAVSPFTPAELLDTGTLPVRRAMTDIPPPPPKFPIMVILSLAIAGAVAAAIVYLVRFW